MAKAQVQAEFTANTAGFKRGVKEMEGQVAQLRKNITASMRSALNVGGGIALAAGGAAIAATIRKGFAQAMQMESSAGMMESFLGEAGKVKDAMKMIREEAEQNPIFSKAEMAEASEALAMFADKSVPKLRSLVETAQKLSLLNRREGLSGAAFSLKEAMGGDYVSLAERFNVSKSQIRGFKDQGLEGQALVEAVLKSMNVTQASLDKQSMTLEGQLAKLDATMASVGEQAANVMSPAIKAITDELNKNMAEYGDLFGKIGGGLVASVEAILSLLRKFDEGSQWLANMWHDNKPGLIDHTSVGMQQIGSVLTGQMGIQDAINWGEGTLRGAQLGERATDMLSKLGPRALEVKLNMSAPASNQLPTGMQHT